MKNKMIGHEEIGQVIFSPSLCPGGMGGGNICTEFGLRFAQKWGH